MFSFQDFSVALNGNEMSAVYLKSFKSRVTQIIKDLKASKADVFEEII